MIILYIEQLSSLLGKANDTVYVFDSYCFVFGFSSVCNY